MFSADKGADVGEDEGTAVASTYEVPFEFNGKIERITIALKEAKAGGKVAADTARSEALVKKGASD